MRKHKTTICDLRLQVRVRVKITNLGTLVQWIGRVAAVLGVLGHVATWLRHWPA